MCKYMVNDELLESSVYDINTLCNDVEIGKQSGYNLINNYGMLPCVCCNLACKYDSSVFQHDTLIIYAMPRFPECIELDNSKFYITFEGSSLSTGVLYHFLRITFLEPHTIRSTLYYQSNYICYTFQS